VAANSQGRPEFDDERSLALIKACRFREVSAVREALLDEWRFDCLSKAS
jgi:hypothetical protein